MVNFMKKIIKCIFCFSCIFILFSCQKEKKVEEKKKIKIVCTTFPIYDWTKNIIVDVNNIDIQLIEKNGVDLHNFQPSVDDIINIQNADLFIYLGGESESWVNGTVKSNTKKSLCLFDLQNDKLIEDSELKETEDEIEYDEHIWLSIKMAMNCCNEILKNVCSLDSINEEKYLKNAEEYKVKLENLDENFETLFSNKSKKTLIVCDRFPFKYFADDYKLNYFAAFNGCSAESEASFEKIAFLSQMLDESNVNCVFILENSDSKIAKTVIQNSNKKDCKIFMLNSMQGINENDIENGISYVSCFERNFSTLKSALE